LGKGVEDVAEFLGIGIAPDNEVETVRRFTGKGLAGFIQKPYSAVALGEKVRSVLENPN
jgi:hypothetical protein